MLGDMVMVLLVSWGMLTLVSDGIGGAGSVMEEELEVAIVSSSLSEVVELVLEQLDWSSDYVVWL